MPQYIIIIIIIIIIREFFCSTKIHAGENTCRSFYVQMNIKYMVYLLVIRCQYLAINFVSVSLSAKKFPTRKATTRSEFLRISSLTLVNIMYCTYHIPTLCCNTAHKAIRCTELRVLDTIRSMSPDLKKEEYLMCGSNDINRLTPNDPYMGRTAPLTSKRCILYIYSTNIGTEYFKHALYSPFFLFNMQFVS